MSYKSKLGLISQSFFVFGVTVALSASLATAQNPYYSATANSQVVAQGSVAPAQTFPNGGGMSAQAPMESVPSVYDQTGTSLGMGYGATQGSVVPTQAQQAPTFSSVGQNMDGYGAQVVYQEQPTYGAGFSTMPEYPRNDAFNASAPSTPDPEPAYPKTKEEMVPEHIHRNPPLTPYDDQETYSYVTETATSNSTACQLCNEGYGNPYLWQFGAAAKIKHRSRIKKGDVAFYNNNGSYGVDSNTNFPISAGVELNATRYLGRNAFNYDIWADISYEGLYEWESEESMYFQDTVYSNFGIAGLSSVKYDVEVGGTNTTEDSTGSEGSEGTTTPTTETYTSVPGFVHMKYNATMNSGNLMFQFRKRGRPDPLIGHPNGTWSRECQGGLRYTHLFGINYTSYNESLDWAGTADVYNAKNEWVGNDYGYANIDADNNMLGLVLGGEMVDKHCVWSWGMRWKLAPYLNFMENKMVLQNNQGANYVAKCSETDISYMAEWGIFTTYKMGKHVIWRLGYDVSCLGNIALAGQNMTVGDSINNNNYNIFQEITLGCTLVW